MSIYSGLSEICILITCFMAFFALACFIALKRLVKKHEDKRLEIIENQLLSLLRLMTIGVIIAFVFGLLAIFTR